MISQTKSKTWILPAVWLAAIITMLPVIFHWPAAQPHLGADRYVRLWIAYAAIAGIAYLICKVESARLVRSQVLALVFLLFLLTCVVNNLHYIFVDHGAPYFGSVITNWQWQSDTEDLVVKLNLANIPHIYRFLPNGFVRWLQLFHLNYESSRDIYRLMFNFLLFYAVYRFARLYTTHVGALIAVLLSAVIYPVSFENYAGQLTDPMAHLAFVLALIFLSTGNFGFFLTTLLIGSVAKETVLALAGCYLLFCRRDSRYGLKAISLIVLCPLMYFGVRFYVLHAGLGTARGPSGSGKMITDRTWVEILGTNMADPRWPAVVSLTALALLPFLFLAWRSTPALLRYVAIYVFIVVLASNVFFGTLAEARNLMPIVFVLAVIAGRFLAPHLSDKTSDVEQGDVSATAVVA